MNGDQNGADEALICPGDGISVRRAKLKGRGVFADRRFTKGTVVEKCPVMVIPAHQMDHIYETDFSNYVYPWGETGDDGGVPMGFGLVYNHSYTPNADWLQDYDALIQSYVAIKDIEPGEEITVNYNGPPEDNTPLWFEVSE